MTAPPSPPLGSLPLLDPFFEAVRQLLTRRARTVRLRYAAAITPDAASAETVIVGTLTAGITVNNPTGSREGMWLRFDFTQDGSGGHAVTWGTAFKVSWSPDTAAGKRNTISFRYDGTSWVQMATATGL